LSDSVLVKAIVASVRNTLRDATDAEIELTNSGVHRVIEDGKLCGFSDTGERTLIIRFVNPETARSDAEAKREFTRAKQTMKLVRPGDGYEEIQNTGTAKWVGQFSEFRKTREL
jgi:hypothetical protein